VFAAEALLFAAEALLFAAEALLLAAEALLPTPGSSAARSGCKEAGHTGLRA
jgi:hypothetical protein